jgi:hypothetical protein
MQSPAVCPAACTEIRCGLREIWICQWTNYWCLYCANILISFACCLYFLESSICLVSSCLHLFCCISCKYNVKIHDFISFHMVLIWHVKFGGWLQLHCNYFLANLICSLCVSHLYIDFLCFKIFNTKDWIQEIVSWWANFYSLWTTVVSWFLF